MFRNCSRLALVFKCSLTNRDRSVKVISSKFKLVRTSGFQLRYSNDFISLTVTVDMPKLEDKGCMDLSVLEGEDPAGYEAQEASRRREEKRNQPKTIQMRRSNPGTITTIDPLQPVYRRQRGFEHQLDEDAERLRREELAKLQFKQRLEERKQREEQKTEAKRAKRRKRKQAEK